MEYLHVGRTMRNEECHLVFFVGLLEIKVGDRMQYFFPSQTWSHATKEVEL